MAEYTVEKIRDLLRGCAIFPREIANIIVGYSVTSGDLLLYLLKINPEFNEDEPPISFFPWYAPSCSIHIYPKDNQLRAFYGDNYYDTPLAGNEDPLSNLTNMIQHAGGFMHTWNVCVDYMSDHITSTAIMCLTHLLAH